MKPSSRQIDGFFDIYKNRLDLELVHFDVSGRSVRSHMTAARAAASRVAVDVCGISLIANAIWRVWACTWVQLINLKIGKVLGARNNKPIPTGRRYPAIFFAYSIAARRTAMAKTPTSAPNMDPS
jgi:hypothetical protein